MGLKLRTELVLNGFRNGRRCHVWTRDKPGEASRALGWFHYFRNRFILCEALSVFFRDASTLRAWTSPLRARGLAAFFRGALSWVSSYWLTGLACRPIQASESERN